MRTELAHFRDAVKLYLELTGGPSPELCRVLLKAGDWLAEADQPQSATEGRSPAPWHEIGEVAAMLLINLAEGVLERLEHPAHKLRLRASLDWASTREKRYEAFTTLWEDLQKTLPFLPSPAHSG